jgi:hypothetical protein
VELGGEVGIFVGDFVGHVARCLLAMLQRIRVIEQDSRCAIAHAK